MALSADALVSRFVDQEIREIPVGAAETIYAGALVGLDPGGYLKPYEPPDDFVGIAYEPADNSAGAVGAINCKVYVQGDFEYTLASAAIKDAGKAVFATADDAIALTGHFDAYVGRIVGRPAADTEVAEAGIASE